MPGTVHRPLELAVRPDKPYVEHTLHYLIDGLVNGLDLKTTLRKAGAEITSKRPDREHIDLSPTALDKSTILDLIKPR